ncbi:g5268 [Coccomyxa elongata]
MVKYEAGLLNVTSGGQTSHIKMPLDATVEACRSGMLYVVNVVGKDGNVLSEVAFNSQTGCIGANTLQVASMQGGPSADSTSNTAYASQAGIPLPVGYTPPAADTATAALNPNPCLGQDPGFSNGLSSAFYSKGIGKGRFDTELPTFQRCDCPNHKTVNASWPGYPALPQGNFIDSYEVRMVGEFLVTRPEDGVIGETPDIFPAASDYHLVCLQHDDSADMIIDGNSYYSSDSNTSTPAGFKQYCVPIPLAAGWHKVELRYSKSPLDRTSVFRFFVVDAEQVETVYTSGVPSNQILWKGQGKCCTGGDGTPGCMAPLDCCKFRNTGCAVPPPELAPAPAPLIPESTLLVAPAPAPIISETPAPAPINVETPVPAPLPLVGPAPAPIVLEAPSPAPAIVETPTPAPTPLTTQPVPAAVKDVFLTRTRVVNTAATNTTVAFFDYGANTTSTYQLQLTWDPAYLGPLILDLVPPLRASSSCLLLQNGTIAGCPAVNSVQFKAKEVVQVQAVAYKEDMAIPKDMKGNGYGRTTEPPGRETREMRAGGASLWGTRPQELVLRSVAGPTDRGIFFARSARRDEGYPACLAIGAATRPGRRRSETSSAENLAGTAKSMGRQRATLDCSPGVLLELAVDVAYGSQQRRDLELQVSRALLAHFGPHLATVVQRGTPGAADRRLERWFDTVPAAAAARRAAAEDQLVRLRAVPGSGDVAVPVKPSAGRLHCKHTDTYEGRGEFFGNLAGELAAGSHLAGNVSACLAYIQTPDDDRHLRRLPPTSSSMATRGSASSALGKCASQPASRQSCQLSSWQHNPVLVQYVSDSVPSHGPNCAVIAMRRLGDARSRWVLPKRLPHGRSGRGVRPTAVCVGASTAGGDTGLFSSIHSWGIFNEDLSSQMAPARLHAGIHRRRAAGLNADDDATP